MRGGRAYPAVILAGAALSLAFPEPDIAPLAWVSLVPLLLAARGASAGRGFGLGFAFGVGFFGALLIWISIVGYIAWALLIVLQSLFTGLFGLLWSWLSRHGRVWLRVAVAAAAWVAVEYVRSVFPLRGFTWGQLAQSQHDLFFWTLRPAAWGGAWLVAAILVAVNACIAEAITSNGRRRLAPALAAAALLTAPLALPVAAADGPVMRVAIVQGNVPRQFTGGQFEKELAITRSHARLTKQLDPGEVDLVVWPESAVGLDLQRAPVVAEEVASAAQAVQAPMIVGGNLDIDADRYKVVAFHVSPEGEVVDVYQKTHLVPFGEYVPGRDLIGWLPPLQQVPRDAVVGAEPKVFALPKGPVATVISFEGDFGSLVRKPIAVGGRLLVVATNTSTWEESWASAQHVAFSQVRAAENGVGVVHAALSGISAFIEPGGELVEQTGLFETTTLVHPMSLGVSPSFYARTGDWFAYLALVLTALAAVGAAATDRRSRRQRALTSSDE
ncbi:MAG: apolipoprotein N-acyltransferase [Actinomycetota bacterium]|nr:apolipoprotein N-acyltransferase [Actinomycetota bacterium]